MTGVITEYPVGDVGKASLGSVPPPQCLQSFNFISELCPFFFSLSTSSSIVPMYLPNELLLHILQSLEKADLKSARLVCKSWYPCASHYLFDKIYVAPNMIDVQVFDAVTQHPILRKCVRHLVYDASVFAADTTKEDYLAEFFHQMSLVEKKGKASPDNTDPEIIDLVNECDEPLLIPYRHWEEEQIAKWKDHSFFDPGYQAYQEHSLYQQRALQSGDFLQTLVLGLLRLSCLESVSLQGEWGHLVVADLGELHYGTPLARRWNPFYCCPHRWAWEPGTDRHFWIITTALADAKTNIDEFAIDRNFLANDWYLEEDRARVNGLESGIAALSRIKRLHLNLQNYPDVSRRKHDNNVKRLPNLLGSMHSLPHLYISAAEYHTYSRVFLQEMTWNDLKDLTLHRFSSTTTDLLRLLLIQMPRLRTLIVGFLGLMHGSCWASLIECLRQFHHFTTFEIDCLAWCNCPCDGRHRFSIPEAVDYVMNGGRHPCLSEEQPTSASEAYVLQIDASLRDSLYEMKRSRTQHTI